MLHIETNIYNVEIPHGSSDHIKSTDDTRSIANNVDRVLVKKKLLKHETFNVDMISNMDIYDTYKDLY